MKRNKPPRRAAEDVETVCATCDALRAALAQEPAQPAVQEPVAWGMADAEGNIVDTITSFDKTGEMKLWEDQYPVPLYAAPQPTAKENP